MIPQLPRAQVGQSHQVKLFGVVQYKSDLRHVFGHGPRRVRPKGIKVGPYAQRFECHVAGIVWVQTSPPDVLTLTARALEWGHQVISRTCIPESHFIFYLGKGGSVEVLWYFNLELISGVRFETLGTPRIITRLERSSGMPIVCADNSRLERDSSLTALTSYGQFPPPCLAPVVGAKGIVACLEERIFQ